MAKLSLDRGQLALLSVFMFSVFTCCIPYMSNIVFRRSEYFPREQQSYFFVLTQIVSISASIPSLLHAFVAFIQGLQKSSSLYYMACISIAAHLLMIVIPNLSFLFIELYTNQSSEEKMIIIHLQMLNFFNYLTHSYLNKFGSSALTLKIFLFCSFLGLSTSVLFSIFTCYDIGYWTSFVSNLSIALYLLGLISFTSYSIRYFIYLRGNKHPLLSTDEFCCCIYLVSVLFLNFGYGLLKTTIDSTEWLNVSATFLAMYTLLYLVTQVLNTLFLGVAVRREALKTEVCIFRLISSESSDGIL